MDMIAANLPKGCDRGVSLWIDGGWHSSRSQTTFDTVDPATGTVVWHLSSGTAEDIDLAVAAAWRAAPPWRQIDGIERGRILRRAADLIRARASSFGHLDTIEAGRPIRDTAQKSAEGAARLFDFYAGMTDKLRGHIQPIAPGYASLIEYEPYGVVGAISPWNYPLSNAATKVAPALACGNCVVLKPAEHASLSALLLAALLQEAGLPAGVLNVVTGLGAEAGRRLVEHPRVPKISFTGSTVTGRQIASTCGQLLKSATLELGGKSAVVVFPDADIERAAKAVVFSAFNNQGQTCSAGSRLVVHAAIRDRLLELVRKELGALVMGDPKHPETKLGPLVSKQQVLRVGGYMALAKTSDITIETPSLRKSQIDPNGFFVSPVILHGVPVQHRIAQEEIFGPVLSVCPFETDDEALEIANATPYGLVATIWTTNQRKIDRLRGELDAGLVWINCVHVGHPGVPVQPRKSSGAGIESGLEVIREYMIVRSSITAVSAHWKSGFDT